MMYCCLLNLSYIPLKFKLFRKKKKIIGIINVNTRSDVPKIQAIDQLTEGQPFPVVFEPTKDAEVKQCLAGILYSTQAGIFPLSVTYLTYPPLIENTGILDGFRIGGYAVAFRTDVEGVHSTQGQSPPRRLVNYPRGASWRRGILYRW